MKKLLADKSNIIILILVITAGVLGYLIYAQNSGGLSEFKLPGLLSNNTPQEQEPSQATNQDEYLKNAIPLPEDLTSEERAIFDNVPRPDATQEQHQEFRNLVQAVAKKGTSITITNCVKPVPLVLEISAKENLRVINEDDKDHTLSFTQGQYKIAAGETQALSDLFPRGEGVYGFGCDNSGRAVGFFLVTE